MRKLGDAEDAGPDARRRFRRPVSIFPAPLRQAAQPGGERSAAIQHDVGVDGPVFLRLEASISASRSQTNQSTTNCTHPTERPPRTLRQSSTDSWKPTSLNSQLI